MNYNKYIYSNKKPNDANKAKALVLSILISAIVFGTIMFVFYHFVDEIPFNEALLKAGLAALVFSVISGIIRAFLNRKK